MNQRNRLAVGIDLGTTNSVIATVINGKVRILPDKIGRCLLPSVVHYRKNGCIVGYEARDNALKDPVNTISSVKRMLGRSVSEIQKSHPYLSYLFQDGKNDFPIISTKGGMFDPIRIYSDILKKLILRTSVLKKEIDGAVITVPAHFDDAQRKGTRDAAKLAGLRVLRLLNEPTAAAVAYGLDLNKEGIVAIYDLGGGTFDISILRLSNGIFEVLSTGGNPSLGGDDFDRALADFFCKQGATVNSDDPKIKRELLNAATKTKIILSKVDNTTVEIAGWKGNVSCNQFNKLIDPLINETLHSCYQALKDAQICSDEILDVVLVGGSTRLPIVQQKVSNFFKRNPLVSIDPDKVVAIGAAIHANALIGNEVKKEVILLDVIPLSLGIETIGGLTEKIIPRNTTIPVSRVQEFTTFKDGQTMMSIHVVQGENELVKNCRSLANFTLRNIPSFPAGKVRVQITFQVDANGILNVTAMEKSTRKKFSIQVNPSYGLTKKKITSMIRNI